MFLNFRICESLSKQKVMQGMLIQQAFKMVMAGLFIMVITAGMNGSSVRAQGYNISCEIKNYTDSIVYLAFRYGDQQYLVDTAKVKEEKFVFSGSDSLDSGIYTLISSQKTYMLEFLIHEQKLSIKSDTLNYLKNLSFKGSAENNLFLKFQNYMMDKGQERQKLITEQTQVEKDSERAKELAKLLKALNDETVAYRKKLQNENPGTMLALMLEAQSDPIVPQEVKENNKKDESINLEYLWFKKHYFDHINFRDDRLIRTPIFHRKLAFYFDNLVPQMPDSIIRDIDRVFDLVEKAGGNQEYYKYLFVYLYTRYNNSKLLCIDKVFVHLTLNYYTKEKAWWASENQLNNIRSRGAELAPCVCGAVSPNMRLKDTLGRWHELSQSKHDLMVLFFWDPGCGHCKKSMPAMKEFYQKYRTKGIKMWGIGTTQDTKEWRDFIKENELPWLNVTDNPVDPFLNNFREVYDVYNTPQIFILDKNNIIKAKKLGIEQLPEVIDLLSSEMEKSQKPDVN